MRLNFSNWTWIWRKSRQAWSKKSSNHHFLEASYA